MPSDSRYTTDGLIQSVRDRSFLPAAAGGADTRPQILRIMTQEMETYLPSVLKGLREEYLVVTEDRALSGSTLGLPARAVGSALRTVEFSQDGADFYPLPRTEPGHGSSSQTGTPVAYFLRGYDLVPVPAPSGQGTVRFSYMNRPGQLVLTSDCAEATTAGNIANDIVVVAAGKTLPSWAVSGALVDVVSAQPNHRVKATDLGVSFVSGRTMVVQHLPADMEYGDFVCEAGTTCVPPFPYEVNVLLAQRAAYVLLQNQGNEKAKGAAMVWKETEEQVQKLLSPRSDSNARPIVSRYGAGARRRW